MPITSIVVTLVFGAVTVLAAHWLRRRLARVPRLPGQPAPPDFAFWPQLIGAGLLWGGLWQRWPASGPEFAALAAAHAAFAASHWWLRRRVMPVLGGLGLALTLLAWAGDLQQPGRWLQWLADALA